MCRTPESARPTARVVRPRKLRDELFQLPQRDDQLILAVALCLSARQRTRKSGEPDAVGVSAEELLRWLDYRVGTSVAHPNIDYRWKSVREVQAALRRLARRKLLRGAPDPLGPSGANLWRVTDAAADYLAQHCLFPDEVTAARFERPGVFPRRSDFSGHRMAKPRLTRGARSGGSVRLFSTAYRRARDATRLHCGDVAAAQGSAQVRWGAGYGSLTTGE
jgi:hypothetical protein